MLIARRIPDLLAAIVAASLLLLLARGAIAQEPAVPALHWEVPTLLPPGARLAVVSGAGAMAVLAQGEALMRLSGQDPAIAEMGGRFLRVLIATRGANEVRIRDARTLIEATLDYWEEYGRQP